MNVSGPLLPRRVGLIVDLIAGLIAPLHHYHHHHCALIIVVIMLSGANGASNESSKSFVVSFCCIIFGAMRVGSNCANCANRFVFVVSLSNNHVHFSGGQQSRCPLSRGLWFKSLMSWEKSWQPVLSTALNTDWKKLLLKVFYISESNWFNMQSVKYARLRRTICTVLWGVFIIS